MKVVREKIKMLLMDNFCKSLFIFFCLFVLHGVLFADTAKADSYYWSGVLKSKNVLSGADITDINDFRVTASVPASTTVSISFSQDRLLYYDASSTKGAWTDCATGTTIISMSDLAWTGALLFYKLKLETTDASSTPTVTEIQVNYDGTAVPAATSTRYGSWGILLSNNMLSGATVNSITGFRATTSLPSGSGARVSFSQDKSAFYSASGTKGAWTDLTDDDNDIDLTGLGWSGASLYYKIRLEALIDPAVRPKITEVRVVYDGTDAPPLSGSGYDWTGVLASSDLLASTTDVLSGFERFDCAVSYLPYGAVFKAQFSKDGADFYSADGTAWGWDTIVCGGGISPAGAIDLSPLKWGGEASFYYKLKFILGADNSYSPALTKAGLTSYSAYMASGTKSQTLQFGTSTGYRVPGGGGDPPVLELKFDELTGTTTYDTSGNGNDGVFVNAASSPKWWDIGKFGSALKFDGVNDYISVGSAYNGVKTVSFWLKADSANEKVMDLNGTANIEVASGKVTANNFASPTIYTDSVVSSSTNTNWHYVAITTDTGINASALDIGRIAGGYFKGFIDHIYFYNYERSAAQIAWDYNKGKAMAYWQFNECQGDNVYDRSGNGHHGSLTIGAGGTQTATGTCASSSAVNAWYNGASGKFESSINLDGNDDYVDIGDTGMIIKTISLWIRPDSLTENIIDLDGGTHTIQVSNGTVTAPGFSSPSVYVNVVSDGSVVTTAWNHILITTNTGITVTDMDIGRIGAGYFGGQIDEVRAYNYVLTDIQIKIDYNGGMAIRFN